MRILLVSIMMIMSSQLLAQTSNVSAPLDHLFIPSGFDNNDNVEVIVTGKFPNPCYTRNDIEVKVQGDTVNIKVTSIIRDDQPVALCEDLKVPFSETVRIGSLQAGQYKIKVNNGLKSGLTGTIDVGLSSSSSVDENLYAKVEYVELGFTGGLSGDATLIGKSISSCVVFDRVEYISNKSDTISILPIMKKISDDCPEDDSRIEIPVKFNPRTLNAKNIMLYVRSIDGKSIHTFINK